MVNKEKGAGWDAQAVSGRFSATVSSFKELRKEELELTAQSIDDAVDGGRSWHPLDAGAFRGRYLS